jgi:hypothetical protein
MVLGWPQQASSHRRSYLILPLSISACCDCDFSQVSLAMALPEPQLSTWPIAKLTQPHVQSVTLRENSATEFCEHHLVECPKVFY